ncbi:hypothetical protein Btru_066877 [Bulinus truncatus]|nr:hypothetical protein Btru_066877 [Bulinus truncatus]
MVISPADCDAGWFGPNCKFMCQCADGCNTDGTCKSQRCYYYWSGYKCQYQFLDLGGKIKVTSENSAISPNPWIDSDDFSCIFDGSIKLIAITLLTKVPFFFIRLAVGDAALVNKFTVSFEDNSDIVVKRVPCRRQAFTVVNNRSVEIRCENAGFVNKIILEGEGVTSLCSIYISRGRNVALKQSAEQTSTNDTYYAMKAVDGMREGNCSLTNNASDVPHIWTLTFEEPVVVGQFDIFSGVADIYFYNTRLQTFDQKDANIYNILMINPFSIILNVNNVPIQKVKITASTYSYPTVFLKLCEVWIYGACLPGKWGLDCKQQCDSKCPDFCREWDGSCPTACLGYQPPSCTAECPLHKWGVNCIEDCSDRCQHKYCNSVDGLCTAGCNGYSDPPYCTKACMKGYYGPNCGHRCSTNCSNEECDHTNGSCLLGCNFNHHGPFCDDITGQSNTQSTFSGSSFGIGFVVGAVAIIVTVVLVAIIVRSVRQRKRQEHRTHENGNKDQTNSDST